MKTSTFNNSFFLPYWKSFYFYSKNVNFRLEPLSYEARLNKAVSVCAVSAIDEINVPFKIRYILNDRPCYLNT